VRPAPVRLSDMPPDHHRRSHAAPRRPPLSTSRTVAAAR
jgi:hypothetical protein